MNKDQSYRKIAKCVAQFHQQLDYYKSNQFNEFNTRFNFINPFFEALGWDISNKQQLPEMYREVIQEDKIKVENSTRAPDYLFCLEGKRIFFVEAKKPSVLIHQSTGPAFQVRRYGWSAQLPVSILTDFEEFGVYNCTLKPSPQDKASTARLSYLTYQDYLKDFGYLWDTFAKENVVRGSLESLVKNDSRKGQATVDREFLQSLDNWRKYLAENISLLNHNLDEEQINYAVQQILDRIIFLRISEDRYVEPYGNLRNTVKKGNFYQNLFTYFNEANAKYNSGLFDLKKDTITKGINLDNQVVQNIINELYPPESPYAFAVMPVEIMGSAYEKFLGKQIKISPEHKVTIEDKPEVRKAGGVYYTPQYIVKYIVEKTLASLLNNKSPLQVATLKIVDPSCGSGSFLLGAYQYLLEWHLSYYSNNKRAATKDKALTPEGRLSTKLKKQVLLNNIYGVDIDSQAVEVTKLSLLLKCMEGETEASINQQLKIYHEKVLPTLDNNIKKGNSLIDLDFYVQLDNEQSIIDKKVRPFNWQQAFPEVFAQQGFDLVIGNPPYVNAKVLVELFEKERAYLNKSQQYKSLFQKWDLYIPFIEKSLCIIKPNALFSMIIPYPFINQAYARLLRKDILENYNIKEIVDLSNVKVFKDATITNCILFIEKATPKYSVVVSTYQNDSIKPYATINTKELIGDPIAGVWNLSNRANLKLDNRNFTKLGDLCFVSKGMVLNADEKQAKGLFIKDDLISKTASKTHAKTYVEAKNIDRYQVDEIRYLEWNTERVPRLISRPTFPELYDVPKILINKIGDLKATFDTSKLTCDQTVRVVVLWKHLHGVENKSINGSVKKYSKQSRADLEDNSESVDYKYILGILNSKLGNVLLNQIRGNGNIDINPEYIKSIPIPIISNQSKRTLHNDIVKIVDELFSMFKQKQNINTPDQTDQLLGRIAYNENQLNKKIYEIYELKLL